VTRKLISVTRASDQSQLPADLVLCDCGHDSFRLILCGLHTHCECTRCGESWSRTYGPAIRSEFVQTPVEVPPAPGVPEGPRSLFEAEAAFEFETEGRG
jgi:hypothetical protein